MFGSSVCLCLPPLAFVVCTLCLHLYRTFPGIFAFFQLSMACLVKREWLMPLSFPSTLCLLYYAILSSNLSLCWDGRRSKTFLYKPSFYLPPCLPNHPLHSRGGRRMAWHGRQAKTRRQFGLWHLIYSAMHLTAAARHGIFSMRACAHACGTTPPTA